MFCDRTVWMKIFEKSSFHGLLENHEIKRLNVRSQFWTVHPQKLDHKIFVDGPSTRVRSLENFWLYSIVILYTVFL